MFHMIHWQFNLYLICAEGFDIIVNLFSENFESFATTNRCSNILKLNSEYAKEVCVIFIRLNRIIILSMSSKNHVKNDFPSAKIQLRFLLKRNRSQKSALSIFWLREIFFQH